MAARSHLLCFTPVGGGVGILQSVGGLIIIVVNLLSRERARMELSGVLDELKCNPGDARKDLMHVYLSRQRDR